MNAKLIGSEISLSKKLCICRIQTHNGKRTNQFCIHYFPKTDEPKSECLEVLESLYDALEIIEVDGDLLRGTNMTNEMDEGVLHFFVNYDFFTIRKEDKTFMEHLEHSSDVKG